MNKVSSRSLFQIFSLDSSYYRSRMKRALTALVGCVLAACGTSNSSAPLGPSAAFVGTWNYDLPNAVNGENLADLDCPAAPNAPAFQAQVPQIGNIVFSQTSATELSGTTDQGCTWKFSVVGSTASLTSPQTCFNKVIGSSYTITQWTIAADNNRVDSNRASEVMVATSHQAVECSFKIASGRRTKLSANDAADPTVPFVGTWVYVPPDAAGTNSAVLACMGADAGTASYVPQTGLITISKGDDKRLAVRTDLGCTASLRAEGNTAELIASNGVCAGGPTPAFWSMATDGKEMVQILSGLQGGCSFLLANSRLVKR
jgi:hypothetical protein